MDRYREMSNVGGIVVIKPIDCTDIMPISCPVCKTMLRGIEDVREMNKLGACQECCNRWAYTNYEKWKAGWRPSVEDIELELINRKNNSIFQMSLDENN